MWFNTPMAWILRSPLHGLLSKSTVLVTVTGRKSGKKYTLPVNYVREGETLWVTSQRGRTWWRNLIGGAPLEVVFEGKSLAARGEALVDESAVIQGLRQYFQIAPQTARYFGVTLDGNGKPEEAGLAQAARERVVVRITL
jgi:deazaflavin-dependent oxidoreductase (nitroreductase family)